MPIILDGKKTAQEIKDNLKKILENSSIVPKLVVILVGDDPASMTYVQNKEKACEYLGISHETIRLPASTSQEELLKHIEKLNKDNIVHGILVQLPLPKQINEKAVILAIDPNKDVDGFHPINVGKMILGQETLLPCTPAGIMYLLKKYAIEIAGKKAVVVGRSNLVGKPISSLLLSENATVTICHSQTVNLAEETKQADILVVAVGKSKIITTDMVKEGAVVIDVGTNWIEEDGKRKLVGDVDFENISSKVKAISPVPGGIGPMTIAMLMTNVCKAAGVESE